MISLIINFAVGGEWLLDFFQFQGRYGGKKTKTFVHRIYLGDTACEFAKYDFLMTYNGARFDPPLVKHEYPEIEC
jgi:uncharacterized protein YprB with RNaseH-like and TPR domain